MLLTVQNSYHSTRVVSHKEALVKFRRTWSPKLNEYHE